MNRITIIGLVSLLVITSCSMEKRRYNRGYHVEWMRDGSVNHRADEPLAGEANPLTKDAITHHEPQRIDLTPSDSIASGDRNVDLMEELPTAKESLLPAKIKRTKRPAYTSNASWLGSFYPVNEAATEPSAEVPKAPKIVAILALITASISIGFLVAAYIAQGWAALGFVAMSFIVAVLTAILTIIALLLHKNYSLKVPVYLWFCAVIGAFGLYALFLILRG